ncbi:MAG: ComEC/Rec2 family competence protein [Ruminococcus sp.]|nr:ComEC/Rec2 family competence protein [Ruminococcus sp.]
MKRKMIGITVGYISGLFFVSFFTRAWELVIPAFAFLAYVVIGKLKNFSVNDFALVSMSFAVAFLAGELYTRYVYEDIMKYDNISGNFSGIVQDYDVYDNDKARYIIKGKINNIRTAEISFFTNELDVRYGDRINIENCTFKKISGDYLFDSETYYKADGIFLSAENPDSISTEKLETQKIKNFLMDYRKKIISDFRIKLGNDCGGFLSGMVFGEKGFLDSTVKNSLYRTGIGHVMAVSGLHISIMAIFIMRIFKCLKINKFISFGLLNIFIVLMLIMAESPVSAVRAVIMVDISYSAGLFRRRNDTFNSLAIAVLIICIANPYVIYSQGFILSVGGTFGIGVFAPYMVKNLPKKKFSQRIIRDFLTMFCTTLFIVPLSMMFFGEISLVSPVMNIIIVPLCTVCMILGMIYTITGGLIPVLEISGGIIKIIIFISGKISELDFSYISCGNDITAKLAIICVVAVGMVKISTGNRKYISVAIAFSVIVVSGGTALYQSGQYNKFIVSAVGKNEKTAVIVSYHGRNCIIDLAGYKNPEYVNKYLADNNIKSIDYLILHKNIQSLYVSYMNELDNINMKNILAYGNINPCGDNKAILFHDDGYRIDTEDYSIIYENEMLKIIYKNSEIDFISTKNAVPENRGLTVFYGNITKNTDIQYDEKSIYLDKNENLRYSGMNNFKIEVSTDGNFSIAQMR